MLATAALLLAGPAASQEGQPQAGSGATLRWEGDRHGTLGPTGRRVFALGIERAPGCRGSFAYGDASVVLRDPIRILILRAGAPVDLTPVRTTWLPSRLEVTWEAEGLRLEETKLVTEADTIADELRLTNLGEEPIDLELLVAGDATPFRERFTSHQVPVDLTGAAVIEAAPGTPLFTTTPAPRAVWVEAEHPYSGTTAARVAAAPGASGSACVEGFGSREGERLDYAAIVPPLDEPALRVRFVNATGRSAALRIEVDGRKAGTVELPPSGAPGSWRLVSAPLPELPSGRVLVSLASTSAGTRVHLDGIFLAERDVQPGPLHAAGAYEDAVPEQIVLPAGGTVFDGVRYQFPESGVEPRPSIVALRGGIPGDPAQDFPERATIALPDLRPAIVSLHMLLATATPRGAMPGEPPATVTFRFDDGSEETLAWPEADALPAYPSPSDAGAPVRASVPEPARQRVEWRVVPMDGFDFPALRLSYVPPPGRFLVEAELAAGAGPAIPLVLAATLEKPKETGRLPVLIGEASLSASPVHVALAATDSVAGRTPAGERCLASWIHLPPGKSATARAVAATGLRRFQTVLRALDLAADDELLPRHVRTFEGWFDEHVPAFTCSDSRLETAWRLRWYLVRHNLLRLDLPDFSLPVVYEGTCCARHARVSPWASSFVLREVRWLRGERVAQGQVRAMLKRQHPSGLLLPISPTARGDLEAHDVIAAAVDVYAVTGSLQFLREVLGLLERDLDARLRFLDADGDLLPMAPDGRYTGMAGRPAFLLTARGARVEPVDLACHLFTSARALSAGYRVLGDLQRARRHEDLARRVRAGVLERCWVAEDAWFQSLGTDDDPIACREIAGLLPLSTGLAPLEAPYVSALETLVSARGLWGPHPVRTVAREDPAYLLAVAGEAPDPLAWNGPVRPEAETWALDALARTLREGGDTSVDASLFAALLDEYTRLHFEDGDAARAILREAYDPESGEGSGCIDVLRSAHADLLIRYVAGLVPRTDGVLELRPLVQHLDHFRFQGLPCHGRLVDVTWDRPDGRIAFGGPGLPEGFSVHVDGERAHHGPVLEPLVLD